MIRFATGDFGMPDIRDKTQRLLKKIGCFEEAYTLNYDLSIVGAKMGRPDDIYISKNIISRLSKSVEFFRDVGLKIVELPVLGGLEAGEVWIAFSFLMREHRLNDCVKVLTGMLLELKHLII